MLVMSGGAGVRSGTPDSVSSAGSAAGQQPRSQYQYTAGQQQGHQQGHAVPGELLAVRTSVCDRPLR